MSSLSAAARPRSLAGFGAVLPVRRLKIFWRKASFAGGSLRRAGPETGIGCPVQEAKDGELRPGKT